ncbi:MAG: hypothetical protein ACMXYK_03765 [Candidatus Woesearchaeota archaeon]
MNTPLQNRIECSVKYGKSYPMTLSFQKGFYFFVTKAFTKKIYDAVYF